MMNKTTKIAIGSLLVAVLAFAGWKLLSARGPANDPAKPNQVQKAEPGKDEKGAQQRKPGKRLRVKKSRGASATAKTAGEKSAKQKVKPKVKIEDVEKSFTAEEKQISDELQKSIDDEKVEDAITLAVAAASSKNPEIRKRAVEALGWFGKKAMAELTLFMSDSDEDVSSDALHQWDLAMSEISSGPEKAKLIELGMQTVKDADALDSMIMEVGDLSNTLAMQTMLNVIEHGTPEAQKVTKEHYEFFTGEEFTDRKAAENWLAENPDDDAPAATQQQPAAKQ